MDQVHGEKDKGVLFDWSSLQVGSILHNQTKEALTFCEIALICETFQRGDYKKLCQLIVIYPGGSVKEP